MDLVSTVRKSGSRGGVNFDWNDVASSNHRENYLGHSLKAPVGRWQKGRDLGWYAKGDTDPNANPDETDEERRARERKEEIRKVKEAEEDAMAKALGLPPPVRDTSGANAVEVANDRMAGRGGKVEEGRGSTATVKEEATERRGLRNVPESDARDGRRRRDSDREHRHKHRRRSRDRSPREDRRHRHRHRSRSRSRSRSRTRRDDRSDRDSDRRAQETIRRHHPGPEKGQDEDAGRERNREAAHTHSRRIRSRSRDRDRRRSRSRSPRRRRDDR